MHAGQPHAWQIVLGVKIVVVALAGLGACSTPVPPRRAALAVWGASPPCRRSRPWSWGCSWPGERAGRAASARCRPRPMGLTYEAGSRSPVAIRRREGIRAPNPRRDLRARWGHRPRCGGRRPVRQHASSPSWPGRWARPSRSSRRASPKGPEGRRRRRHDRRSGDKAAAKDGDRAVRRLGIGLRSPPGHPAPSRVAGGRFGDGPSRSSRTSSWSTSWRGLWPSPRYTSATVAFFCGPRARSPCWPSPPAVRSGWPACAEPASTPRSTSRWRWRWRRPRPPRAATRHRPGSWWWRSLAVGVGADGHPRPRRQDVPASAGVGTGAAADGVPDSLGGRAGPRRPAAPRWWRGDSGIVAGRSARRLPEAEEKLRGGARQVGGTRATAPVVARASG